MRSSFSLVVLALVSVAMLSGCTSTLNDAIARRQYNDAIQFMEKGADVNAPDPDGENRHTPLCNAMKYQSYLCRHGYGKDNGAMGPIECNASLDEQLSFTKLLIAKGAKVNAPCYQSSESGSTALYWAIGGGRFETVKLLVENGADINASVTAYLPKYIVILDSYHRGEGIGEITEDAPTVGVTPLMLAYARGAVEIGNYLVKKGARSGDKSSENKTARDYYNKYVSRQKELNSKLAQYDEAQGIKAQRDKAESRETWAAVGTVAAGVAAGTYVGNRTKDLSVDQRQRMMNSAMNSVVAGDSSEFNSTSNQVTAERRREQATKAQYEPSRVATQTSKSDAASVINQASDKAGRDFDKQRAEKKKKEDERDRQAAIQRQKAEQQAQRELQRIKLAEDTLRQQQAQRETRAKSDADDEQKRKCLKVGDPNACHCYKYFKVKVGDACTVYDWNSIE